jgi:hypothetical protein
MITREVELNIPTKYKDEALFYYIVKNFKIIPKIVEASFSTEMGWAIVKFEGEEKEINRLFDFFRKKNIEINIK